MPENEYIFEFFLKISSSIRFVNSNKKLHFSIGRWTIKNIKATANGEPQEIKVRVRINPNGVILVTSANLVEKKAKTDEMNVENGNNDANNMDVAQEVSISSDLILGIHFLHHKNPFHFSSKDLKETSNTIDSELYRLYCIPFRLIIIDPYILRSRIEHFFLGFVP